MLNEMETWPLWKCIKAEKQAQFIQDIWDKFGIDLLKEDKPGALITYPDNLGDIENLEEIDQLMKEKPRYRGKVWFGG